MLDLIVTQAIPMHDLLRLKEEKIPFELYPLHASSGYDSTTSHRHSYYEIFFFEKGGGHHLIDFDWFPINDYSVHFVSPGQIHQVKRQKGSFGYVLLFSDDFYLMEQSNKNLLYDCPLLNNNTSDPILNLSEEDFGLLYQYAQIIAREKEAGKSFSKEICLANMHLLIARASRFYERGRSSVIEKEHDLFMKFRALLEQNYYSWHHTSDYSNALSVSEKTLNRYLIKVSGRSVVQHIRSRVLLEAKRLLHNAEISVKEIAYALSFKDPSHFSRFFREREGLSPTAFKKKALRNQ